MTLPFKPKRVRRGSRRKTNRSRENRGAATNRAAARAAAHLADAAVANQEHLFRTYETTGQGISQQEAERRFKQVGANEIAQDKPPAWYQQLIRAFWNPFIVVLAVLAVVSFVTGDDEAVVIVSAMVGISVVLRFWQEFRSGQAAEQLRSLVRTTAMVMRTNEDGAAGRSEIPMALVVPGDLVHLSAGDMVPADVRLIRAKDLFVNQSALTGESLPVEKNDQPVTDPVAEQSSHFDLPNICFMGTNVVSGTATALVVATGTSTYFGATARGLLGQRVLTSFDRGVSSVSWLLIRFMLVMVPIVFVLNGVTKGNWWEAFLFAVAVAVGLTPEMLPMIVTANLAKGAVRMARRKSVVKRLNAIQNLGAMDVLCTDKTGTLTRDKIILERHLNVVGEDDDSVLELAYLNSVHQTGLKNLLDTAILEHVELRESLHIDRDYQKIDEIPFDFARRRMSVVVEREHRQHLLICKGAVEETVNLCTHVHDEGRVIPLDHEQIETALELSHTLHEDGLRVVAVAYREFPPLERAYTVGDETGLTLAGFVGFLDPPKESAGPALQALAQHGVEVKILTGDNDVITRKVCREVGIDAGKIVLGQEIEGWTDEQLAEIAATTRVFAKLTPVQKTRVVSALQQRGHTVGFLGDGINDAGALRQADVGISVDSAVDIAKESADIILLEKNLMVLEEGVLEGRTTFGNIVKYIKMTASSNFGNVFSMLGASAILPFLPMLPIQLLIQNLLYDLSQLSIPWDEMDEEYLRVPRKWEASDIGRFMVFIGPVSSIFDYATFAVMWFVFRAMTPAGAAVFQSGWFVEGLISQTLVVHLIRTAKVPFVQSWAAKGVVLLTSLIIAIGVALPFTSIGRALGLVALPLRYFPWLVVILVGYCVMVQVVKTWYIRRFCQWL